MRKFITKKTAVLALLLVAASAVYAQECLRCYCFSVAGSRVCMCFGCPNIN